MNGTGVAGMSWSTILPIVLLVVVVVIVLSRVRAAAMARHREAAERLAQAADADHEAARTRHEGGA